MEDGDLLTLAIESSCDETAAAVLKGERRLLSNVISSQTDIHRAFGGVVPEIASRQHLERINAVVDSALAEAGARLCDIGLIGVTQGPGLVGALLIGLATAKAYAFALGRPIVGVHHIKAHICAAYIENPDLEPPFLALVVSGGHTNIVSVEAHGVFRSLGGTRDDAAGEAFDKVARALGLGYPGGPAIDRLAAEGDPGAVSFKRVFLEKDSLDFSFSGIKTSVLSYLNSERQAGREASAADTAAGFQQAVIDVIVAKTMLAAEAHGRKTVALAGGVAANSLLRREMGRGCAERGIRLCCPSPALCTDNAAMVAVAAYRRYAEAGGDSLDGIDAFPGLKLAEAQGGP
ncbi:MAG: tRNA (adenosine(37)-N6)-threonylcarbamoyltransferase complex transferase subunit TsaD [Clostridiales Family XIII bacterium]|jgi:N6-L-threonylcarbamoyladenine synthase|nr:tRNA (adenosine(37)-N6)-threonylcarbamoyltransferase complex transferase subunit TsaD [Clostridiales Family XIII bacterium]